MTAIGVFDPPLILAGGGVEKRAGGGDWDECVVSAVALPKRAGVPLDAIQIIVPISHDPIDWKPRILLGCD